MPHVTIKLYPGRNDEVKKKLAEKIALEVADGLQVRSGSVSVAFEEVSQEDWKDIYIKEIVNNMENIYRRPDYKCD